MNVLKYRFALGLGITIGSIVALFYTEGRSLVIITFGVGLMIGSL